MRRVTVYMITAAVAALILLFSVSAPLLTTQSDFSIYNTGWNGCSDLAVRTYQTGKFTPNVRLSNGKEMEVVQKEINSYEIEPNSSSILFIGPDQSFNGPEADYVHRFMLQGGNVLLADDFGTGNSLLNELNTTSRFIGSPVLDLSFEKQPKFSVVFDLAEHPMTENVSSVLLNKPTAISKDANATALMKTTQGSWLDKNNNGSKDQDEDYGSYDVMTVEDYGLGKLVLLSDPSILINSMRDELDNRQLGNNLLNFITEDRESVVFDESHREMSVVYTIVYTGDYPAKTLSLMAVFFGLLVSVLLFVPEFKYGVVKILDRVLSIFGEGEDEDVVTKVLNNHPEWEEHRLIWIEDRLNESFDRREEET